MEIKTKEKKRPTENGVVARTPLFFFGMRGAKKNEKKYFPPPPISQTKGKTCEGRGGGFIFYKDVDGILVPLLGFFGGGFFPVFLWKVLSPAKIKEKSSPPETGKKISKSPNPRNFFLKGSFL